MMLIGRDRERQQLLNTLYASESKFIAVYGRRRVGKTYLIRETFESQFTFQHTGYYGGKKAEELFAFGASLREYGMPLASSPKSWLEAFELLKALIRESRRERKVIFLDELSWMDTAGSDFMMALEGFWNGWAAARKDIVLIVCGSLTSWMLSKVVHNKGGLYNRLSFRLHLQPFTLAQCEAYAKSRGLVMNRHQLLECYMIMGGIPYYWSFLQKGKSPAQNVDALFFAEDARLQDEFKFMYAALFKKPESYIKIVRALGQKKAGMTREELLTASGSADTGAFSMKLEELESCGFIRRYRYFGNKERNSVYQLIDNYTLFYYKFLEKRPTDPHFWSNQLDAAGILAWCGLAFERVCLQHMEQLKKALGISGVLTDACAWSCHADPDRGIHGSQIDLLIVRRDQIINLCEMKYARREFCINKQMDEAVRHKCNDFLAVTGTKFAVHPTLVTTYGLVQNAYAGNIQSVITADALFS